MKAGKYLVSAIVSVYNCERFIKGCLEDLERQSIADKIEIIIVNTGSEQNEEAIIKDYQRRFDNIKFVATTTRETIYKAWNMGIKNSSGKYVTNANSDDRHRKDAFEVMTDLLENNEDIDLVFADSIITEIDNETFEECTPSGYMNHPEPNDRVTFSIGPHPMWRKRVHEEFGLFDESYEAAGDYEFWMRIAGKCRFKHINEYLGLYLRNPVSAERRNYARTALEVIAIKKSYLSSSQIPVNLKKKLKTGISEKYSDLANYYFRKGSLLQTWRAALGGLKYGSLDYESYLLILSLLFPYSLVTRWKARLINLFPKSQSF
jgi:glycosyltransferase involved in cell wall biosynthesis